MKDRTAPRPTAVLLLLVASLLTASGVGLAAGGGGGGGSVGFSNTGSSPGQRAISEFRTGEKRLDRARELRIEIVELREEGNEKKAAKLEKKERGMYERAERSFRKAINRSDQKRPWTD